MKSTKGRAVLLKIVAAMIVFDLLLNLTLEIPTLNSNSNHHGQTITGSIINTQEQQLTEPDWNIKSITEEDAQHDPSHQRAVFYNVFLNPTSGITYLNSLEIVHEQLKEIKDGTEVYYTLIGHAHRKNLCINFPQLNCTLLGYQESGGEDLTLQRLYEYCQHDHIGDGFVTYLHDKGSFHFSTSNTRNRRRATRGALSDECLRMPLRQNYSCNLCGTKFQYMPHMNYQANMWTAQCSFVRQLVPPKEYIQKRFDLVERLYRENPCLSQMADPKMGADDGSWQWNVSNPMFLRNVGLGRYALERWMIQHPAMIPCEVWPMGIRRMKRDTAEVSPLTLGIPTEWGKMVSKKVKARQTFYAKEEYAAFYPSAELNAILEKDQSKPKARACWNLAEVAVPASM